MSDELRRERDLDRYWDRLIRGETAGGEPGLDPEQTETLRRFQALAKAPVPAAARERAWQRLRVPDSPATVAAGRPAIGPNGRDASTVRRWATYPVSRRGRHWLAVQFATALLLLVTLSGIVIAFRPESRGGSGPIGPPTELLGDVVVEQLPSLSHLYIHRWIFPPGNRASDTSGGPVFGVVETGQVGVQIGQEAERLLGPGEAFALSTNTLYGVRNAGSGQASYIELKLNADSAGWALDNSFPGGDQPTLADALVGDPASGDPAHVTLVRLTFEPGELMEVPADLAYYQMLLVESGELGVSVLHRGERAVPGAVPPNELVYRTYQTIGPPARSFEGGRLLRNAGSQPTMVLALRIIAVPDMRVRDDHGP